MVKQPATLLSNASLVMGNCSSVAGPGSGGLLIYSQKTSPTALLTNVFNLIKASTKRTKRPSKPLSKEAIGKPTRRRPVGRARESSVQETSLPNRSSTSFSSPSLYILIMGFMLAFGLMGAALTGTSLMAEGGSSAERPTYRGLAKINNFVVLQQIPHAPRAFTQGLQYLQGGIFIEGTGLYGQSTLRKVDATTGQVLASVPLDRKYFGEGITVVDDKVVQITWRERQAFVYNLADLSRKGTFTYDTFNHEGWGITTDGQELIVSDGSQFIYFWDKDTYEEKRRIRVEDGFGSAVNMLNELEYAHGYIWANIWLADDIVQIDPATGKVVAFYDMSALYPIHQRTKVDDVLNGIAFDAEEDVFYLTGKNWPLYFKVAFCDLPTQKKHCTTHTRRLRQD